MRVPGVRGGACVCGEQGGGGHLDGEDHLPGHVPVTSLGVRGGGMRGGGHPDGADQVTSPGRPGRPSPQGGVRVPGVRCVWKLGVGRGTLTVKTTSPVTSPGSGSKMRVVPSVHVG